MQGAVAYQALRVVGGAWSTYTALAFGKPKRHWHMGFETALDALMCCTPQVDGHHIRVDAASAPRSSAAAAGKKGAKAEAAAGAAAVYDPTRSVFVGNLNFQTKVRLGCVTSCTSYCSGM